MLKIVWRHLFKNRTPHTIMVKNILNPCNRAIAVCTCKVDWSFNFIMGQKSQIYIRYNVCGKKGLIARHYYWNYEERMLSRARGIIEALKSDYWYFGEENIKKLCRICDVNFDMRDVMISDDLVDDAANYYSGDYKRIFTPPNDDGQLLIDVTDSGVKYCFIPRYDNIETLDGRHYLIWDTRHSYPHYRWTEEDPPKKMHEDTILYTLDNVAYIDRNATLMTKEEAEEFVNADYSYLFSNIQKN